MYNRNSNWFQGASIMGDFEIGGYLAAVVVFMILVLGSINIMSNVFDPSNTGTAFNNTEYADFSAAFNQSGQLESDISHLKNDVNGTTPGEDSGLLGSINSLIKTGFTGVKFMLTSFTLMDAVFNSLSRIFGIPDWVSTLIISLITILIIFAIFKLIFRSPTV